MMHEFGGHRQGDKIVTNSIPMTFEELKPISETTCIQFGQKCLTIVRGLQNIFKLIP